MFRSNPNTLKIIEPINIHLTNTHNYWAYKHPFDKHIKGQNPPQFEHHQHKVHEKCRVKLMTVHAHVTSVIRFFASNLQWYMQLGRPFTLDYLACRTILSIHDRNHKTL